MKSLALFLFGLFLSVPCLSEDLTQKGIIGETTVDGNTVIYKFVDELPKPELRTALPWLVVISWNYSGENTHGMPGTDLNERMRVLEDTIYKHIEIKGVARHVYSKTGNNLKELVYYTTDQSTFLAELNAALRTHPRYPIGITFYEDKEWSDFTTVLGLFNLKG